MMYGIGLVLLLVFGGVILYFWQRDQRRTPKSSTVSLAHSITATTRQPMLTGAALTKHPAKTILSPNLWRMGPSSPFANASPASAVGGQHCTMADRVMRPGEEETQLWYSGRAA